MESTHDKHLIRSLQSLNSFIDGSNIIATGQDFVALLESSKKHLLDIGKQRETSFYEKELMHLPEIHYLEIDEVLKRRTKERNVFLLIGGYFLYFFVMIINLIRTKGKSATDIKGKLSTLKRMNNKFINTLEKPGMEEFYLNQ